MLLLLQRQAANFDQGWRFHLGDVPGAQDPAFADASWRTLDVPHDWSIEGEFSEQNPAGVAGGALAGGVGGDRKVFAIPPADRGKLVFVEFDGAYPNSEALVNRQYLGKRPDGFRSFRHQPT